MSMFKIIFGVLILIVFGVIGANAIDQSICSPGANMVLYPNGSLKTCVLKDSFSSNEIKCKSQNSISFYDNGQLETCVLAESAKVSGQECKESGPISFYPDGKFKSCVKKD
jgi:hypothetical protein